MKTVNKLTLDEQKLQRLLSYFDERKVYTDQEYIYKGHIPHVGILLLDGLMLAKNTRSVHELERGSVVGVKELLEGNILKFSIEVKSGSRVLILDRSSLIELKEAEQVSKDKNNNKLNKNKHGDEKSVKNKQSIFIKLTS